MNEPPVPDSAVVDRCQTILAHAWMVRTVVKHSPEVEDFPEVMGIVRNVFDLCRAVESRVSDPPAYVHQLRKKLSKLKAAAAQFAQDAPVASDHTNFRQAVISMDGCVRELEGIVAGFSPVLSRQTNCERQRDLSENGDGVVGDSAAGND
jgi:hypothetical protein